MFTSPNLTLINAEATTMETSKLNTSGTSDKLLRVLKTASFEANVLREDAMDRAQWTG
jgi:hypothetical protein